MIGTELVTGNRTKIIKSGLAVCFVLGSRHGCIFFFLQEKQALICWLSCGYRNANAKTMNFKLIASRCRVFDCKMLGLYTHKSYLWTIKGNEDYGLYHRDDF